MTELGIQARPPPMPQWGLYMAPDLTQWQWKPPTQRPSTPREPTARSGRGWSLMLPRPPWLNHYDVDEIEGPAEGSDRARAPSTTLVTAPFFAELAALSSLSADPPNAVALRLGAVAGQLQQLLALGAFSGEEIGSAVDSLSTTMREGLAASYAKLAEEYSFQLWTAVLIGVTSCKILPRDHYGERFWSGLLSRMAELPVSDRLGQLFEKFMEAVPEQFVKGMRRGLASLVNRLLDDEYHTFSSQDLASDDPAWATTTEMEGQGLAEDDVRRISASERVQSLARALNQLHPIAQHRFRKELSKTLLGRTTSNARAQRRRVRNWLSVLARMAHVEQRYLFGILEGYGALCHGQHLPRTELCDLLIAQWGSRGYTDASATREAFRVICRGDEETALAALALCVSRHQEPGKRRAFHYSLWRCLRKLGLDGELVASLRALSQRERLPLPFLEHLAWISHDLRLTAAIKSLYSGEIRRNNPSLPMWHPRFWNRRAGALSRAMDVSLTAMDIYEMLDLWEYSGRIRTKGRDDGRRWCKVGPGTEALVVQLAVRFTDAPDLSNREAFRRISHCRQFLLNHGSSQQMPLVVTRALFENLTQLFARNQVGSRARFRWFIGAIKKQFGEAAALDCARKLDRGRERVRRDRLGANLVLL